MLATSEKWELEIPYPWIVKCAQSVTACSVTIAGFQGYRSSEPAVTRPAFQLQGVALAVLLSQTYCNVGPVTKISGMQLPTLHQRSSKIIKHHLLFHQLMAFPAQAAYGEYQAESAPWSNLYACGDCRRGASLVVTAIAEGRDCASRVDAMLMGTTTLPRAAPLAANPTFYQMPQKVSNTQAWNLVNMIRNMVRKTEYGIRSQVRKRMKEVWLRTNYGFPK